MPVRGGSKSRYSSAKPYLTTAEVVFVDHVVRSPTGKADYRWAAEVAAKQA